jgi:hypothetical protein
MKNLISFLPETTSKESTDHQIGTLNGMKNSTFFLMKGF